ncbi:MAG: ATP-binding cassette domain-containing protein [Deltaproteobacteria bacterium]|jgi:energy-coupling factor transport system ATP-binding protein|nr:ATP-binding cassette domain-containing protein [Deltaproteobacteria bacterium]
MSETLTASGLTFGYDEKERPVFANLSLSIDRGRAVLLMGPSGCGKSSLALCLAGLYPEYAGRLSGAVAVGDERADLRDLSPPERVKRVGLLFQNPDDQFCMGRVDHEIMFALENVNYRGDIRSRTREALALCGVPELETASLATLSAGQKQKAALAAALAPEPSFLIADEPLANVDPESGRPLAARLKFLVEERGLGLLIVDHNPGPWRDVAHRVLLMDENGRLTADIPMTEMERHRELFDGLGISTGAAFVPRRPPAPLRPGGPTLTIENLSVRRGRKETLNLSLSLPFGTLTALTGPNGGGKTTFLWALAGLLKTGGRLDTGGRLVGLVFQDPACQFLTTNVLDEIALSLKADRKNDSRAALETQALALLDEFGLADKIHLSPYQLSQGQRRRLAVLTILAGGREILLLDEPTYAQDERSTRFVMELLAERTRRGATVVMATHDPPLADAYAHRVIRLENGRVASDKNTVANP